MVKTILHIEGLIFFLLALFLYQQIYGNWWFFALFLFAPDISMVGYLKNNKIGALFYNLMHNYILAFALMGIGFWAKKVIVSELGIILLAHVSLDRLLGFGLKYTTDFKHTHLQKL
ncbi:MAG: DUF4260 domain-containing protein [Candidatus Levyibacteriota bacterium]